MNDAILVILRLIRISMGKYMVNITVINKGNKRITKIFKMRKSVYKLFAKIGWLNPEGWEDKIE